MAEIQNAPLSHHAGTLAVLARCTQRFPVDAARGSAAAALARDNSMPNNGELWGGPPLLAGMQRRSAAMRFEMRFDHVVAVVLIAVAVQRLFIWAHGPVVV